MNKIIMILLTIFLTSCMGLNKKLVCRQVQKSKIKALPICDISFKFNRCNCSCFALSDYKQVEDIECGEDFQSGQFDLIKCEGVMGFQVKDWAEEIRPKIKKLNNLHYNLCN